MARDGIEREFKLMLTDAIERSRIEALLPQGRRLLRQRNIFFDTDDARLTAARLSSCRPSRSVNTSARSRVLSPRANSSTARSSSASVRPCKPARSAERNGSSRSATWGAAYAIGPSAVFSRPVRYPFR